ncbi:hypothetical protein EUAN_01370 [Andreesenia angusta]|uniref:Uncharacterized protein n=1 Tax=Andreesenia angusta TaxID=39480 RepID=A0A1S1V9I4_9FIRM|nr:hypothetical protein [Andreesenia angusta]OHW63273.1 hypothetical protein EUAN_01370 [Andreesenia angusta]
MNVRAFIGVLLLFYGALVVFLTLNKPKVIWNMKKIKLFEKLLGERGTVVFFYVFAAVSIAAGIWLLS